MKHLILLVVAAIACGEPEPETFDPCMPNAQNKTLRLYGPWGGLQDHETDTTSVDFARSFNVEVDGREIRSRRGRVPYLNLGTVPGRCHQVIAMSDVTAEGTTWIDATESVSDGLSTTAISIMKTDWQVFTSTGVVVVISPRKFAGVRLRFKTLHVPSPLNIPVIAWRMNPDGTQTQMGTVDGTNSMTQDGTVTFSSGTADWAPGSQTLIPFSSVKISPDEYAMFLFGPNTPSNPTNIEIAEMEVLYDPAELAVAPSVLMDWNDATVMIGKDLIHAGGSLGILPVDGDASWFMEKWGRYLIGVGGRSPVVFDGTTATRLAAVPGQDSATTGYLSSLPNAQALAVYRGRLYLAHGKTVIFSELNNALNIIPYDGSAPQRGANVWPASNNFDASGEIAGFAVFGDRLVIATDVGLDVWDGHSRQSVPGAPGCVAGHTIAETRKGLAYLALDGVYLFNGASARHISGGISETLERVSKNAVHGAVGVAYPAARQYRLYVPVNGSARNTLCLAWNYEDDRWFPLGGTPPWLDADERYREMEVAAACVANVGADGEVLLTADYDGNVWVEDRGFTDGGYTVSWVIAFKRLGLGEDEGMRTWRNVRISAKATGAPIKLAMLPDGDDLETSVLAGTETGMPVAGAVATLTEGQATWMMDAPGPEPLPDEMSLDLAGAVERDASGGSSPTSVWRSFPVPHARVTRTIQPVLYCDGVDSAGARRGTKAAVRGIEVDYRIRTGRRSLA
jgi:hypothetical protein